MLEEYRSLGLYLAGPSSAPLRPHLDPGVLSSQDIPGLDDGTEVTVAGLVIRRQRPLAKAVFVTLEDEFRHIPLVIWPTVYARYRLALLEPVLIVRGVVSRREGTMNIVAKHVERTGGARHLPKAKNWKQPHWFARCVGRARHTGPRADAQPPIPAPGSVALVVHMAGQPKSFGSSRGAAEATE